MPTYDYECEHRHVTERLRLTMMGVDDDPGIFCGECGEDAHRVLTFSPTPVTWEWEMVAMKGEPDVPTRVGF